MLCRHLVCSGRGEKIINNDHRREKGKAITELQDQFYSLVTEPDKARQLVAAIRQDKPRYIRDQLSLLIQVTMQSEQTIIGLALNECCEQHIYGAADFKAIVAHYHYLQKEGPEEPLVAKLLLNPLNSKVPDHALMQPATSSINDYNMF